MESTVLWNRRIKNSLKCSASVKMGIFLWNVVELLEKGQKLKKFDVTIDITTLRCYSIIIRCNKDYYIKRIKSIFRRYSL